LLEAARLLAEEPIDTELRFVSFGASEQGQRGSNAYVQSLPADVKKRISAVFQLERIGSGAAGDLVMDTADGKPNRATELGARAGAVLAKGEKARQKIVSDHLVFAAAGIPAALFHNAPSETWYDQREDTVSQIGKEQLLRATQTVISAVYQLAQP
jgi:aminopeptidase YwaD